MVEVEKWRTTSEADFKPTDNLLRRELVERSNTRASYVTREAEVQPPAGV